MHVLKRIDITGLRGRSDLAIEFHRDVNFLIGVNGSGKTTAINLIAAVLSADFQTLDRLPFRKITLQLQADGSRQRPAIEVEKKPRPSMPFPVIKFSIRDKASSKPVEYSLEDFEEKLIYRDYQAYRIQRSARSQNTSVLEHLKRLRNLSWLSIHRFEASSPRAGDRLHREERYESTVDRKLDQLGTDFVKYFSMLAKLGAAESANFQKTVFRSLIHRQTETQLFNSIGKLNLPEEEAGLLAIFREFNLNDSQTTENVTKHFKTLTDALGRLKKAKA